MASSSLNGRNLTVACLVGVGSFFAYSLMKRYCPCNQVEGDGESKSTKGSKVSPTQILNFWFGAITKNYDEINKQKLSNWYSGKKEFDEEIRAKFGDFMKHVLEDKMYEDWRETPKGTLALILIADQFSRNVYRNTRKMFKYDAYALELCYDAMDREFDVALFQLHPSYFHFSLMPLMHSEDIKHHELYAKKQEWAINTLDKKHPFYPFISNRKWAIEHMDVIKECGRYPQRNDILGRVTTEKEKEIIKKYNLMQLINSDQDQ